MHLYVFPLHTSDGWTVNIADVDFTPSAGRLAWEMGENCVLVQFKVMRKRFQTTYALSLAKCEKYVSGFISSI